MAKTDLAQQPARPWRLLWVAFAAILVTGALIQFGRVHEPDYAFSFLGISGTDSLVRKSQIANVVLALALVQLVLALWMYGALPGITRTTSPVKRAHRVIGLATFLLTLPVATHCMFAYGFQTYDARVTVHSLAGCFLYGAFLAKVLLVRARQGLPGWVLPLAGGLLVTLIGVLWYTSALWFYNGLTLPFS
jgi:hypothetical protein